MGTTYEEVMSLSERNKLIMRTEIYSEFAGFLNKIEKQIPEKFRKRYLYIALQENEEVKTDTEQIIGEISTVKENMSKIEKQLNDQDEKIEKIAKD